MSLFQKNLKQVKQECVDSNVSDKNEFVEAPSSVNGQEDFGNREIVRKKRKKKSLVQERRKCS